MNPIRKIAGKLHVLTASKAVDGWRYGLFVVVWHKRRVRIARRVRQIDLEGLKKQKGKNPWALIIHGVGIVEKPYSEKDESVQRIVRNPADFLSVIDQRENGTQLVFLRRGQYDSLLEELAPYRLPLVGTRILASDEVPKEVYAAGRDYFTETLLPRNLIRPTAESNTVSSLLFKRLLLPVAGTILVILLVNFSVQQRWQQIVGEQRTELGLLERNAAVRDKEADDRRNLHSLYLPPPAYPYGYLADRVGTVVPAGVMLTSLAIHPLSKKIQENKPLAVESGRLLITGQSPVMPPVTAFADSLRTLAFTRSLKLLSVDKDRNNLYAFQIEIGL